MRQNAYNVVVFVLLAGVFAGLWWYADRNWFPKKDRPKDADPVVVKGNAASDESIAAVAGAVSFGVPTEALTVARPDPRPEPKADTKVDPKADPKAEVKPAPPPTPAEPPTLIALGEPGYYNFVTLSTRGGGVQQIVLPKFQEADRLGRSAKKDGATVPLYLVPGKVRPRGEKLKEDYEAPELKPGRAERPDELAEPAYTLFHYATPGDQYPDPTLGTTNWKVVAEDHPPGGVHSVTFEAELGDPYFLRIRKTYTLGPKDYHVGLRVEFERLPGGQKGRGLFRHQVSGPRGIPVEGEWYTSTYRVALIGWANPKGAAKRQYEDSATIAIKRGGDRVERGGNQFRYAAVSTQFFTSALAVDDAAAGAGKNPWEYVRATTELPFDKVATAQQAPFEDISFRAVAEPLDLAPGEKAAHSYLIYNGPSKVRLLKLLEGDRAVPSELVDRYHDGLGLKTLTDYRSPTTLGAFADAIYWTDLVIVFTNLMHWLLAGIHYVIGFWGPSIVVLTVLVRLILFIPSRKQTQMNLRMMEVQKKLKPELDKLHEKYKDDFNTYNREKTRLMMQHGVNPFAAMGGCLLLFAQMPIFMGLYFCLQESIFFRLEPFLWVENLAAPDMTVWWGEAIPYLSAPGDIGSFFYLGPYLNILPLVAVGLMLYQQHKMMPEPTDEQMAQQQRIMKIMMIVMAVMFYKVAAGLCLYFIASTLWGIVERQLIPKAADPGDSGIPAGPPPKAGSPNGKTDDGEKPRGMLGRLQDAMKKKMEELQKQAEEQSSRQVRRDREGPPPPRRDTDRRKKKRK